jgi:hypothetical protein
MLTIDMAIAASTRRALTASSTFRLLILFRLVLSRSDPFTGSLSASTRYDGSLAQRGSNATAYRIAPYHK